MSEKVILAYSGGLDTSVAIHWLTKEWGYEVIALTVDVGMDREREILEGRPSPPVPPVFYGTTRVTPSFVNLPFRPLLLVRSTRGATP